MSTASPQATDITNQQVSAGQAVDPLVSNPTVEASADFQNLDKFRVPAGFRGRHALVVVLWQLVQATLFGLSPQPMYGWRRWLLRLFGASIGRKVLVRPTARVTYPWKVEIGDFSWIGDNVEIYSLDRIYIGHHSVISQRSYLCSAAHNMNNVSFDYITAPISIGSQVWISSDVFVCPGVMIGEGAVIGVRSTVFDDIPPGMVAFGQPARVVRSRRDR